MSVNIMSAVEADMAPFRTSKLATLVLAVVHAGEAENAYHATPEAHDDLADIRIARVLREARTDLVAAFTAQGIGHKQAVQMAEVL